MNMDEFNQAREQIREDLVRVIGKPSPENLSQLMIKLALHGLVVVPFDHYPDSIPQPICAMIFLPADDQWYSTDVNTYLVPADQIS